MKAIQVVFTTRIMSAIGVCFCSGEANVRLNERIIE